MAIVGLRQVNLLAPADVEDQIGNALCLRSMQHFTQYLGQPAIGLGYNSCNASVAIAPHAQYDAVAYMGGPLFSVLYGSSRLYSGLDPDFNALHGNIAPGRPFSSSLLQEHAEQSAIRVAVSQGLPFWNHAGHHHLYVDLSPCVNCGPWLTARGENWFVHYYTPVAVQQPVMQLKRKYRRDEFGRQMEPPLKRKRV